MNVTLQNHIKTIGFVMITLGIIATSIPVDLPLRLTVVAVLEVIGLIGQIVARYGADPTLASLPTETLAMLPALTSTAQALNTSLKGITGQDVQQQVKGLDPAKVASDIQTLVANFEAQLTQIKAQYSTPPAAAPPT